MDYSFSIKSSHPSLKGHFPNNPIVPGVVILDEVISLLNKAEPNLKIEKLPMVKFTHTLLADQLVTVEFNRKSDALISFTCLHDGIQLVTGQLKLMSTP